jgi:amino acid transporter
VTGRGASGAARLRRDLGVVESYAALLGILIGAGIFTVTSRAWLLTGPSLILGYIVLLPVILASSVPYAAYLSTPLGREPGGEYTHISRTLGGYRLAFIGAWLKTISYIGAGAFLANSLADYIIQFAGGMLEARLHRLPLALASLVFFFLVHAVGVRWFGRLQVSMCAILGISLVVLIVPGLFAIKPSNYSPFAPHGAAGFASSLIPLFFSYAGFESLAQTAGEVKDSTRQLPRVFIRGITITAVIFFLMSVVAFGVLPGERLGASTAPMAEAASVYLPVGAASLVTLGAIMAITTSLNSTLLVPSRLAIVLAGDGLAPPWLGAVNERTGTPINGLALTLAASSLLLVAGQVSLALNIAVFALVILYGLHSLIFLLLPRRNPKISAEVTIGVPRWIQIASAAISVVAMAGLSLVQIYQDVRALGSTSLGERVRTQSLTTVELALLWGMIGALLYSYGRWRSGKTVRR